MKRVLLISDTHGRQDTLQVLLDRTGRYDLILHMGDAGGRMDEIVRMTDIPVLGVRGNCDMFSDLPLVREIMIGSLPVLITHGHRFSVHFGLEELEEEARLRCVSVVCFGHTHEPCLERRGGITFVNPGSLSLPRQEGWQPSYAVMEVDDEGQAHFAMNCLKV